MKLIYARLVRRVFLTCGLLALVLLLGTQALPASAESASFVRLVNASPDVGTVAVFVDGAKFLSNAMFASITDYLQLPAGHHRVQVALVGKGIDASVIVQTLLVQAGTPYTVVALGTRATGYSLKVFVDDNLMAVGMAKVRFYDLSPRAYSLSIATGGLTIPGALSYRQASNYLKLPAGLYTFTVSASRPSFSLLDQVTLKPNMVTSIFIVGVFHGNPPLAFVHVQVNGLPSMSRTGSDLDVLASNQQSFIPLSLGPLVILALGGVSAAMLSRFRPFARKKTLNRFQRLLWSLFALTLALAISVGGLLLAATSASQTPSLVGHLLIPAIGVDAPIETVGVLPNSDLATPTQSPWNDVGWYSGGPQPGEKGSAVINGHLDRPGGSPAVFWNLRKLHIGDVVSVVDSHGRTLQFHVIRMAFYPPQDAPVQDIFGNKAGSFLNLMTCAGDWMPTQHQRDLRLVVYTAPGAPANAQTSQATSTTSLTNTQTSQATPTTTSTSNKPTSQPTPTVPTPTAQPIPKVLPTPTPTPLPPPPVSFQVTGIGLSVSPASIASLSCGRSVTFGFTATFYAVPHSGGGTVQFTYTWNGGLNSSSASLTFAPGQTSKTFTFTETILLSPLASIGFAQVAASSPNAVYSPRVQPTGLCIRAPL